MVNTETIYWHPDRVRIYWLSLLLILVLLPHVVRLPVWIILGFVVFAYWRVAHVVHNVPLPSRKIRFLFSLGIAVGILLSFGTVFGRGPGTAALAILAGMKLLETETLRDAYATVFLGIFLGITNFLYSQSIGTAAYMIFVVVIIVATLIAVNNDSNTLDIKINIKKASKLLLCAAPMMLILFVLFPRIPGPLWGLPKDATTAISGLSDSMSPGTISQLGLSPSVAFRAKFNGKPPPQSVLYWRGPVLTKLDGKVWTSNVSKLSKQLPIILTRAKHYSYTVTIEPHDQRWVFGLDTVGTVPPGVLIDQNHLLLTEKPITKRTNFNLYSFPHANIMSLSNMQRQLTLRLPIGNHLKTQDLARQWRNSATTDQDVIDSALTYFRTQGFSYTLQPPLLPGESVDQFLFETRQGFCEHYASAFAVLMRSAGIPTRIVTGYQGGEFNPLGKYMIIRQHDAHAWNEVWLSDRGWVRIDPTAVVSPERIEFGFDEAITPETDQPLFMFRGDTSMAEALRNFRLVWDSANNIWNQWILGYGPQKQYNLMSLLGINSNWQTFLIWVSLGILGTLFIVGFGIIKTWRHSDPITSTYGVYCRKLHKIGLIRAHHEGPLDFAVRVTGQRPDLGEQVMNITKKYINLRYSKVKNSSKEFFMAVSNFQPSKIPVQEKTR